MVGTFPRREERPHARGYEAQVRGRERVGVEALPGRDAAGEVAAPEGEPMGLSESAQNPDGTLGHPARPILDIWQKFESGSAFVLESALPEMRRVK